MVVILIANQTVRCAAPVEYPDLIAGERASTSNPESTSRIHIVDLQDTKGQWEEAQAGGVGRHGAGGAGGCGAGWRALAGRR